jgi:hypothetical protein
MTMVTAEQICRVFRSFSAMRFAALILPLFFATSCPKVATPLLPDSLSIDVDLQRETLLDYYELNGRFPKRLGDIDPKLESDGEFDKWWSYVAHEDAYRLLRKTVGSGNGGIWFDFNAKDKGSSGWTVSKDHGRPPLRPFGLSKAEEKFFERHGEQNGGR